MTWISLVCFLALTSSAFGRSAYGSGYGGSSYGSGERVLPLPTYGSKMITERIGSGYGSSYGGYAAAPKIAVNQGYGSAMVRPTPPPAIPEMFPVDQGYGASNSRVLPPFVPPTPILTEADILCQGQQPETVIPLDGGRRFVVCVDEAKGFELQCPKGLVYHPESRRCERKLGPLENLCVSQPCLNGAQCIPTGSSYECQCAPGYDGKTCELDATVCQTRNPCGQAPDARCQSYRANAALTYICIFQNGEAYGFNSQQITRNPCQGVDGPRSLEITDKGFIMCDGDRMFIDSCPGGTIWDDLNKACSWPDLQGLVGPAPADEPTGYGQPSYGSEIRTVQIKDTFEPLILPQPKPVDSYGQTPFVPPPPPMTPTTSYGRTPFVPPPMTPPTSYGRTPFVPPPMTPPTSYGQSSYGKTPFVPPPPMTPPTAYGQSSYGKSSFLAPKVFRQPSGYGASTPKVLIPETSGY